MPSRSSNEPPVNRDTVAEVLNRLRDDVNEAFGVADFGPRVNKGPCGPFAARFVEAWNPLFPLPCRVCFLIEANDPDCCYHCFVQLPDGRFFDGGHGVVTQAQIEAYTAAKLGPDRRAIIEVMDPYDEDLFDRRSYGRIKSGEPVGPHCPDYSDQRARELIERRLQELARIDSQNASAYR